jgi:hypothetical protein
VAAKPKVRVPSAPAKRARDAASAGYSGTPLAQKLGIKPGHTILITGKPPATFANSLNLPEGATIAATAKSANVIIHFTTSAADLRKSFPRLAKQLDKAGGLWISWPKKSSGIETDLSENPIREIGLAAGLVDNKVCAIDHTWSGLRFVYRLADR